MMGGAAAYLARNWLQSQVAPPAEHGTIVVATTPLAFGVTITEDKVAEIPWAANTLPQGAFASKQDLLKDGRRVVLTPVERNEPVLRSKITAPGQRGSLSAILEEGKRAVTVRVDDVRGVAGFILPGDRVDIALIRSENNGQSYSDLILQQVKVLAIDQIANERTEQPTVAKAVTLEVTADEAQKVILATNIGKLSLILRQAAGQGIAEQTRRITERDLAHVEPAPQPVAAPAPAPAPASAPPVVRRVEPATATIGIVRGLRKEEYTVLRD
jgi:pilus assembly protein CpaB